MKKKTSRKKTSKKKSDNKKIGTKKFPKLILSIVGCLAVGLLGGIATSSSVSTWYLFLHKPFFTPPSWVFGPVWTMLYILMGVAFYLIWTSKKQNEAEIFVFVAQLAANALWSFLFFGLQNPFYALIDIILLEILIIVTVILFFRVDKRAGYLLIPYLLWVSFATFLNFSIWRLNYLM